MYLFLVFKVKKNKRRNLLEKFIYTFRSFSWSVYLSEQHERAIKEKSFFSLKLNLSVNVNAHQLFWGKEFNIHELCKISIYIYILLWI